jgi:hypothetical protein
MAQKFCLGGLRPSAELVLGDARGRVTVLGWLRYSIVFSSRLGLSREARNRPDAHSLLACNCPDALARGSGHSDCLDLGCVIRDGCRTPKARPIGLCTRQSSQYSFANDGSFKFGKRRQASETSRALFCEKACFRRNFSPPGGSAVTSLGRRLLRDAQSLHRAHDGDLVPNIAASWGLDAAISQRLRDLAIGPAPHCFQKRP